jgi:glycerol-3-phosphate acyltransferase PlsX
MIRVAVDALGGDRAPEEIVRGAVEARSAEIQPILYGPSDLDGHDLPLVATTGVVEMEESPVDAVRAKPDSSLVRAVRAVADGEADTVVSAGNTGAMLAASLLHLHRLPGVHRPGIGVVIPGRNGPTVLIDAGANADARPEHLLQFAHMGAVFAEEALGATDPSVALLSIGEEPEKGNRLVREAHELLAVADLRYTGNVEGRQLLAGVADVIVCDGFTGNVTLKISEGLVDTVEQLLHDELSSTFGTRVGYLLSRQAYRRFRKRLDYSEYGGAPLLGVNGLCIVGHGRSSAKAVRNAVAMGARAVGERLVQQLARELAIPSTT